MTEERLITLANMPSNDEWSPEWARGKNLSHAALELGYCMEENSAPFSFEDIASVLATHTDAVEPENFHGMGDREWEWTVTLTDGRHFFVTGWHDYTGWDCQSGAEYVEIEAVKA